MNKMVSDGESLLDILYGLKKILSGTKFYPVFNRIIEDIESGETLSKALRKSNLFDSLYINFITAGESTGALDIMFKYMVALNCRKYPPSDLEKFTFVWATSISCGVPIKDGINLGAQCVKNSKFKESLLHTSETFQEEKLDIHSCLDQKFFPEWARFLIYIGEMTGRLDDTLSKIAEWEKQGASRRKGIVSDMKVFLYSFLTMIIAGFPELKSLKILSKQHFKKGVQNVIKDLILQIETGKSLDKALSEYPKLLKKIKETW